MDFLDKIYRKRQQALLAEHFDADDAMFLERELIQLRATTYTVEYPELIARTFAPKATDIAASVDTYSYKVYTPVGRAQWLAYRGGGDVPRVDVQAKEVFGNVRPLGVAYGWTIAELREAARLQTQLPTVKATLARDATEQFIDDVLAFGTSVGLDATTLGSDVKLSGLTNNPNVTVMSAAKWWDDPTSGPTPQAVLADLNDLAAEVTLASDGVFNTDTILLPTRKYNHIKQTVYNDLSGESILTVFRKNNPEITTIAPWNKLNHAGVSNAPRSIAYSKQKKVLEAVIPQEFESLPPEARGFEFIINCHARCGGMKIYLPPAMRYRDFATS